MIPSPVCTPPFGGGISFEIQEHALLSNIELGALLSNR